MNSSIRTALAIATLTLLASTTTLAQEMPNDHAASNSSEQKKGTGVVPPNVKLIPEMPAAGAPKPFKFPEPAAKTLAPPEAGPNNGASSEAEPETGSTCLPV